MDVLNVDDRWRMRGSVPIAVTGIVFPSGGQSEIKATAHVNAINRLGCAPWEISFSFGRELENSALNTSKGVAASVPAAQKAFYHRAKCHSFAGYGKFRDQVGKEAA